MLKQIAKIVLLFVSAGIAQNLANAIADIERGYEAIGGEFLVFPVTLIIGAALMGFFDSDPDVDSRDEMEDGFDATISD